MKNFKKMMENNWAAYAFATCSAVLLFIFLTNFDSFLKTVESIEGLLSPIIIGAVLAYLLNPIVAFFEQRALKKIKRDKTRYSLSVILAVVCFVAVLVLFFLALIRRSSLQSWISSRRSSRSILQSLRIRSVKRSTTSWAMCLLCSTVFCRSLSIWEARFLTSASDLSLQSIS